jgi:hypothetical protein
LFAEAFTNLDPEARLRGRAPGDALELCYAAWRGDLLGASGEEALETIFADLNRDARPNERAFPSLSVGDVVSIHTFALDRQQHTSSSYAVAPVGFAPLADPVQATRSEHDRLRQRLSAPG